VGAQSLPKWGGAFLHPTQPLGFTSCLQAVAYQGPMAPSPEGWPSHEK
jgi:hypothetical protein